MVLQFDFMKRISLLFILLGSFLAGGCGCSSGQADSEVRDNLIVGYMQFVSGFYDYSLVEWDLFAEPDMLQNKSDWGDEVSKAMDPSWTESEMASVYWERLQSAKVYLHCRSLPLRALATPKMIKEMDALEEALDDVFLEMVSQEYYMRVFPDVFDEIIPPKIDRLAKTFSKYR